MNKGEKKTGGAEPRLFPAYTHDVLYEVRPFLDLLLNIDGLSLHSSSLLGADGPNEERGFCAYFAPSALASASTGRSMRHSCWSD